MNHGGRMAMLGLPSEPYAVDWGKVVTHMLTLKGIYGREMFETWNSMSAMLQTSADAARRASPRSSPTGIAAREWRAGFDAAASGGVGKVILDWTEL